MIKQVRPSSEPPYWVCVECNWAWQSLQEANRHSCNGNPPAEPAFRSVTSKPQYKSVWVKPVPPKKPTCEKLGVCQSNLAPSCRAGVCRLAMPVGVAG